MKTPEELLENLLRDFLKPIKNITYKFTENFKIFHG